LYRYLSFADVALKGRICDPAQKQAILRPKADDFALDVSQRNIT
jgi:hypothetical protein